MRILKSFFLALILFLVLDFVWLGSIVKSFNLAQLSEIGRIQNGDFDVLLFPALTTYVLMALMMVHFIFPRVPAGASISRAFAQGAFGGFLIYGIYDLTNLAILRLYPAPFAMADMMWGTLLFGIVTVVLSKTCRQES